MGIFNRKTVTEIPKVNDSDFLKEYASSNDINMYNFIQGIRLIDSNYINNDALIDRMIQDSVISSAIDMWTEDALQKDPQTKEIFNVEVDNPDGEVEEKLSKGLSLELNRFLKDDLRMDKYLVPILKRILIYGDCPVKLDFADVLDDEKLKLKESNIKDFRQVTGKLTEMFGNTEKDKSLFDRDRMLNEDCYNVDWENYGEDVVDENNKQLIKLREGINKYYNKNKLNESVQLKEADLLDVKRMVKGRWYTQILGNGTNIYELSAKQKVIAYMDRDFPDKYIKPDRIVYFSNNTGKHRVVFEVGEYRESLNKKQYYQIERGESFVENSMVAWQVLSALEDILLLTRMTRSILYRIFSVEVGNKGNKETADLLSRLKNKVKMDETVNVREKIYNSTLAQVPLGDSIFIPTRNGVGVIDVKTVGGDVNLHDAVDLDYFKDKVFAGLRIPAPFLGFTESLPGGIGDTSLTRMDIRYSRTITRIQNILAEGLKDLCLVYLKLTRTDKALNELPDFKIVFTSINSAEDISRANLKQTQMETLKAVIEGLSNLGIDLAGNSENYELTRQQLIREYYGSVLLDKILEDEKSIIVQGPTEGNAKALSNSGGPSLGGAPSDIISGPGNIGGNSNEDEEGNEETEEGNEDLEVEPTETEQGGIEEPREIG